MDSEGEPAPDSRFDTVEELRLALLEFKDTYNREWIIGCHGYKTPSAVRAIQKETANLRGLIRLRPH